MARMIPDLDLSLIKNRGERIFYEAIRRYLPNSYTVVYGYRYMEYQNEDKVREMDFIIFHPTYGFIVVEVKQGETAYHAGQWHETKQGGYLPLHKDPVEQSRSAMCIEYFQPRPLDLTEYELIELLKNSVFSKSFRDKLKIIL